MKNTENNTITIFTDGSSRGNPGPGGWGAIVALGDKVFELGGREDMTTNNRMELTAAMEALKLISIAKGFTDVIIFTDSKYLINGVTKWVFGWKNKGWKTTAKEDVLNRDLWEEISELKDVLEKTMSLSWQYVAGHAGIGANERCDVIATSFADNDPTLLFNGARADYKIDISAKVGVGESVEGAIKKSGKSAEAKARSKMKAFSYLSVVGGVVKRHTTWAECEARVKGVKGARYKKAVSAGDENVIIKEWGEKISLK